MSPALLLLLVVAVPSRPEAFEPRVAIQSLEFGFERHFKVGHFVPARVQIRNAGPPRSVAVSVLVPDDHGAPCRFTSEEVQLTVT